MQAKVNSIYYVSYPVCILNKFPVMSCKTWHKLNFFITRVSVFFKFISEKTKYHNYGKSSMNSELSMYINVIICIIHVKI